MPGTSGTPGALAQVVRFVEWSSRYERLATLKLEMLSRPSEHEAVSCSGTWGVPDRNPAAAVLKGLVHVQAAFWAITQ